jgi:hypothetical protein
MATHNWCKATWPVHVASLATTDTLIKHQLKTNPNQAAKHSLTVGPKQVKTKAGAMGRRKCWQERAQLSVLNMRRLTIKTMHPTQSRHSTQMKEFKSKEFIRGDEPGLSAPALYSSLLLCFGSRVPTPSKTEELSSSFFLLPLSDSVWAGALFFPWRLTMTENIQEVTMIMWCAKERHCQINYEKEISKSEIE